MAYVGDSCCNDRVLDGANFPGKAVLSGRKYPIVSVCRSHLESDQFNICL